MMLCFLATIYDLPDVHRYWKTFLYIINNWLNKGYYLSVFILFFSLCVWTVWQRKHVHAMFETHIRFRWRQFDWPQCIYMFSHPVQSDATVSTHYQLGIHGNCTQPEVGVSVTAENSTTCAELRDTIFTKKPRSGCDSLHYRACDVIAERQSINGKRECGMICKCAESADQCVIYILSGTTPKDLSICEIAVDGHFLIWVWPLIMDKPW